MEVRIDSVLKFAYTTSFTNSTFISEQCYSNDKLCPRFLIGTPGCIGAGLDCSDVKLVKRIGLRISIIDMVQEMGRCGRLGITDMNINLYSMIFTLSDYTYLIERLYVCETTENDVEDADIPKTQQKK